MSHNLQQQQQQQHLVFLSRNNIFYREKRQRVHVYKDINFSRTGKSTINDYVIAIIDDFLWKSQAFRNSWPPFSTTSILGFKTPNMSATIANMHKQRFLYFSQVTLSKQLWLNVEWWYMYMYNIIFLHSFSEDTWAHNFKCKLSSFIFVSNIFFIYLCIYLFIYF